MDAVTRRDLLNCSLSLERFDRDLRFQLGTELSVLSHVCLLRQPKSTLGPCPNFGEYLTFQKVSRPFRKSADFSKSQLNFSKVSRIGLATVRSRRQRREAKRPSRKRTTRRKQSPVCLNNSRITPRRIVRAT